MTSRSRAVFLRNGSANIGGSGDGCFEGVITLSGDGDGFLERSWMVGDYFGDGRRALGDGYGDYMRLSGGGCGVGDLSD